MIDIDQIIAEVNKHFKENVINRASKFTNLNLDSIPSGSSFLDWCMGHGFPKGKTVELYGLPSGGKSLIAAMTVAQAQKLKGECVWIDAENAFDPEFVKKLGVDIKKIIISQSSIGEPTLDLVCKLLEAKPAVIVIDSVASMVPMDDMEKSFDQPTMATRARLMSKGLAKITALNKGGTLIIFINQLRTDIGSYGGPSISTGGRALGHYASVRVEIKRGDFITTTNKEKIGQIVKFRVTKNKVGIPWREGYFKFFYDGHIGWADEMVSLALLNKKIQAVGAWYEILGQKMQGRENIEAELEKNPEFKKEFEKLIK